LNDEEYVRAYLLIYLVTELGYRGHPSVIEFEKEYNIGRPAKGARVDVILRYPLDWADEQERGRAFLFIECKAPEKFDSDRPYLKGQVFDLSRQENPLPRYGVYYTTRVHNGEILDRALIVDLDAFASFERWDEEGQPANDLLPARYALPERIRFAHVEQPTQAKRPLRTEVGSVEFDRLRGSLHEIVWGGGGTNNNDVFVTLVRLFLCRIYDELETAPGEDYRFQRHGKPDGSLETPDEVVENMSALFGEAAFSYLGYTAQELEETTAFERKKIAPSKVAFVVEQLQGISLTRNTSRGDADILGEFFEKIVSQDFTQTKGQFFTHVNLIQFVMQMVRIGEVARDVFLTQRDQLGRPKLPYMIDPSAGSGSFLVEAMKAVTANLSQLEPAQLPNRLRDFARRWFGAESPNAWARDFIYGIEPNPDLGLAAKVNMILHGDGSTNTYVMSGLLPFSDYALAARWHALGTMSANENRCYPKPVNEEFDFVFSNPPFSVTLSEEEKRALARTFVFAANTSSENLFVERWYQLLREGGTLGVVIPESLLDTSTALPIRLFLYQHFWIDAVVSLPYLAFRPFTSTKTTILIARKKKEAEIADWNTAWKRESAAYDKAVRGLKANRRRAYLDAVETLLSGDVGWDGDQLNPDSMKRLDEIRSNGAAWVFRKVMADPARDYDVFMAEPDHVGYKRRKGLEDLVLRNDLLAPALAVGDAADAEAALDSVLARYRAGYRPGGSRRYGFWIRFSDIGVRPALRCDPKYHHLWTIRIGRVFENYGGELIRVRDLLVGAPREKLAKGPLDQARTLVDLADVESRTSILLGSTEVDELGSDKVVFGDASLAVSKLEPYLGKIIVNQPEAEWIGSTEWLLFNLAQPDLDAEYVRYLLLLPEMLDAYRCLQSGKRHARFTEDDFLDLLVPDIDSEAQQRLADTARAKQTKILRHRELARRQRDAIDEAFATALADAL
jgi:type I restriction enzyme M protein